MRDADTAERDVAIRMIRDSAAAIAPRGDLRRIRALRHTECGFDPAVLRQMGELGWIGLRLPEAAGGADLGMTACCALAEELGRALVPEPLIPAMLSAALLSACGEEALLARVLAGKALVTTAWQERVDTLHAPGTPGAPRLFIPLVRGAEAFLLPVDTALHLLPAAGRALEVLATQDGGHLGTLHPDAGATRALDELPEGAMDRALDEAALATAGYLLGVMEGAFAMTLDYLRTRQQFGRPIGTFQALQHRAVDLKIQLALTRASVEAAAATLDAGADARTRAAAVSRAKARAAEAAMLVTRAAVQMHGAIGYTDEHDIGLYLRKAMVACNAFGSGVLHRRRFVASAPDEDD
ncbi:acyl-CoA dehydrogenase family protein [Falsiroseomonas sp. HC035]|uniref:acyl-CoA dehydrogenase family protein n=1 Tax=Falsiroseomonas sp. HC035 TaxID=3390999 RepID=UPI003D312EEA